MPYTPDADNLTEPTNSQSLGSANEELIAIKSRVAQAVRTLISDDHLTPLPLPAFRAGRMLAFDSPDGDVTPTPFTVAQISAVLTALDTDGDAASFTNSVNITDTPFNAIIDGNGLGGGTNNSAALNSAITSVNAAGGGQVLIPFEGTGVCLLLDQIDWKDNVRVVLAKGASVDLTGGVGLRMTGTQGAEINTSANVTSGETSISTVSAHGLAVGDYFLLWSQRACLHADAGTQWRLGETTGGTTTTFFAEVHRVYAVTDADTVQTAWPILFPNYRIDATLETPGLGRTRTTISKLNFLRGAEFDCQGKIISTGITAFKATWALKPKINIEETQLSNTVGAAIRIENCFRSKVSGKAIRPSNWVVAGDHSAYNSFKDVGSWFTEWDYEDEFGCQGLDISWQSGKWPGMWPMIKGKTYGNIEDGLNFHSGCFGGTVRDFISIGNKQSGIVCHSRFVRIYSPIILGPNTAAAGGIVAAGWGLVDGGVYGNGLVKDLVAGYGFDMQRTGNVDDGPVYRNMDVELTIENVVTGMRLRGSTATPPADATALPSGIRLKCNVSRTAGKAISIEAYVNYVTILGGHIGAVTVGVDAITLAANAVGLHVKALSASDIGAAVRLIAVNLPADTTTYPAATWKTTRSRINWAGVNLSGTGIVFAGTLTPNTTTDYVAVLEDADNGPIRINSATGKLCTISPASLVPWPTNARIEIVQIGAGQITVTQGAGVTINSSGGKMKTAVQHSRVNLVYQGADVWNLSGETAL